MVLVWDKGCMTVSNAVLMQSNMSHWLIPAGRNRSNLSGSEKEPDSPISYFHVVNILVPKFLEVQWEGGGWGGVWAEWKRTIQQGNDSTAPLWLYLFKWL